MPQIVLPFKKTTTYKLEDFLKSRAGQSVRRKRGFYVLTFNIDRCTVVKIGIASRDVYSRLQGYMNSFGKHSNLYPCRGVWIHFLLTTSLNKRVGDTNSAVSNLEKLILKEAKAREIVVERGKEYLVSSLSEIERVVKLYSTKDWKYYHQHKLRSGSGRRGIQLNSESGSSWRQIR